MTSIRRWLAWFALALWIATPAQAQATAEPAPALQGMDVVSYFDAAGQVKGQAAFGHDFDGAR